MTGSSLWLVVLGCGGATFVWRLAGAVVVKKINPDGAIFEWVTCVSYAMVASLIFRMIMMPESELANVSLPIRVISVVIALVAYYLSRRMLLVGVMAGGISLSALVAWFG